MRFTLASLRTGLLVALSFALLSSPSAHADDASTSIIGMSPTNKHYSVKAGDHLSDTFTVINAGKTSYDFKVYARPYLVDGRNYEPVFTRENEFSDGYKWISLPTTTYHVDAGAKVAVPFDVVISSYARSGGHYAAIFAESQGSSLGEQTGVTTNKSVGLLVYIDVAGSAVTKGKLNSVDMPWYQPSAPLTVIPRIENTGETDFSAHVTFAVMDILGNVKYQISNDYALLPKTERDITLTWSKSPWFGLYKVHLSTTVLGKTENYDSLVVIAPRWLLFAALLVLMLGVIDVVRRKRTTIQRKAR